MHFVLSGQLWTVIRVYLDKNHILWRRFRYFVCDWTQPPAVGSPGGRKESNDRVLLGLGFCQEIGPLLGRDFAHVESTSLISVL